MDILGANRTFDEYDPAVEWSRAAEADVLKISLPGFKREEIRVLVDNKGRLRTRGERPVAGTRWIRFQKDDQLPANCNADGIRAKFQNETLTITLPKKTPSPQAAPVPEPTRPAATTPQKPPPAVPELVRPALPLPLLTPAPSHHQPAERRPSLPMKPPGPARLPSVPKPTPEVVPQKKYNVGAAATAKPEPPPAAVPKPKEQEPVQEAKKPSLEEEEKRTGKEKAKEEEEAVMEGMQMARRSRPISASRGLLVNVAVAVVVLAGITVYVWHALRNVTGGPGAGDHGHGELGTGSYGDEM
ncbi:proline-rich receptor-like protein kinase PERK8 [Phragmites australis]|uniref:proline-rich receptor-like protein kinase PERK8 n=1 Tax=Phragmites australis TaxID=29695 RepID=UPI002D78A05C|nr:proline-rich receptor-like protein kinase PERK8 [Phragmites australis]